MLLTALTGSALWPLASILLSLAGMEQDKGIRRDLIVVGGSMGELEALRTILATLPMSTAEMPDLIVKLTQSPAPARPPPPRDVILEAQVAERVMTEVGGVEQIGSLTQYGCPDCGGPLSDVSKPPGQRYRCHIGHSYTTGSLLEEQEQAVEKALWIAYRTLSDRLSMLERARNPATPGITTDALTRWRYPGILSESL